MQWRYEFILTKTPSIALILDSGEFPAIDANDAKLVLAAVVKNIKTTGPTMPNAIRLIDPDGQEIWRALLATRKIKSPQTAGS
jgi:hypothetical protein